MAATVLRKRRMEDFVLIDAPLHPVAALEGKQLLGVLNASSSVCVFALLLSKCSSKQRGCDEPSASAPPLKWKSF